VHRIAPARDADANASPEAPPVTGEECAPARMVDVAGKPVVARSATAEGFLHVSPGTLKALKEGTVKKGDPIPVARTAAIMAVKRTPDLIPLCHPIPITGVDVDVTVKSTGVAVTVTVRADYRTGVEMEALTAVTVALLTVWDMTKYLEKDEDGQYPHARISDVRVVEKRKGNAP
jgi:cyclic pyranopterin monophosphate synthase